MCLVRRLPYAGIVGNGRTCALIDARGRVAWLCLPTFAQFPVFAGLLDPTRGGCLEPGLRVRGQVFWSGDYGYCEQRYLDGTNVLVTTWSVAGYQVTITDAMPWRQNELIREVHIENEGEADEMPTCLVRMKPNRGELPGARFDLATMLAPSPACIGITDTRCPTRGHILCQPAPGRLLAAWAGEGSLLFEYAPDGDRLTLRLWYQEERIEPAQPKEGSADPITASAAADRAWLANTARLALPDAGLVSAYDRSLLALRLLCYGPTGAILAAPTASFPSEPGGDHNWDYRFCWVRDGCYTAQALGRAGALDEARALYGFLLDREKGGQWPSPLWPIEPGYTTNEGEVAGLCGPGGETPIRVGNDAARQDQHDSPGNVLTGVYQYCLASGDTRFVAGYWPSLTRAADWCAEHWAEHEAGIWEKRDRPRPWVHGRAMCWAGLRDAARLARILDRPASAGWESAAARIAAELVDAGWSEARGIIGRTCAADESPAICDASVLALVLEGLVDPADPRMLRTVDTLAATLGHRGGYRRDEENRRAPFGLATLWMARSLLLAGDYARGHADLQAVIAASTDLGLLAEYFDPVTGRQWGNFPQAFSHEELVKTVTGMLWDWDGEKLLLFPGIPPAWLAPGAVLAAANVPAAGRRIAIKLVVEEDALHFAASGARGLTVRVPPRYADGRHHVELRAE